MENNKNNLAELLSLIKYPSSTEKSASLYGNRQYTFIVDRVLTKLEIRYVLENILNVTITDISTCILPPKNRKVGKSIGKRPVYKKAFITLKNGDTISEFLN